MRGLSIITVAVVLAACGSQSNETSQTFSLTGEGFEGEKFYLGWGAASRNDPQMMHNEVKYDVFHTHDIFTEEVGGDYIGEKLIGWQVRGSDVRREWDKIGAQMDPEDMFVQYSSGHGFRSGLAIGLSYDEIRDNALAYPASEIIIFIMACKSGGLVNSFDRMRHVWENWQNEGRTLLVMASSSVDVNSATGPGRDPDEPGGPYGSAGSAFGHALWKALIGYADGYVDGVKDGYLNLEEIIEFTKWKTYSVGRHRPVLTGTYDSNLIMNRVPPRDFVDRLQASTEGMSEAEVVKLVQELDRRTRI